MTINRNLKKLKRIIAANLNQVIATPGKAQTHEVEAKDEFQL